MSMPPFIVQPRFTPSVAMKSTSALCFAGASGSDPFVFVSKRYTAPDFALMTKST